jgi:hypothetical protein
MAAVASTGVPSSTKTGAVDEKTYLSSTGTLSLIGSEHATNTIVATSTSLPLPAAWTIEQLTELYSYRVPPLGPDGSCR